MNNEQELERDFYRLLESIDHGEKCYLSNYHIDVVSRLLARNFEQVKSLVKEHE